MFYTFSGKKINAHSGEKDLLKRLCRKERLIWNQGLEGHLKRGRVTAFNPMHTAVQAGSLVLSAKEAKTGPSSQKGLSP